MTKSASYDFNSSLTVRAGIDNLFDASPPLTGATTGVALADVSSRCDGKVAGCSNPGGPSLARTGTGTTAKGFYNLGRKYFVGISAKF